MLNLKRSYLLAKGVAIGSLFLTFQALELQAITEKNSVMYHVTFPVTQSQGDLFILGSPYANTVILSNLIAGVLYGYLIHEKYPRLHYENDMLYGTLMGQLLQESGLTTYINSHFVVGDPSQLIHAKSYASILLSPGQGGPYQINDYSKRLPSMGMPGSLGLANYDAVRKVLGYSIASQDSGEQTQKQGPQALENIYAGPVIAAYFHFNDINRMHVLSENAWYQNHTKWHQCISNLQSDGKLAQMTNIVMNVVYNAGTYSGPLSTYLGVCDQGAGTSAYAHIDDYTMSSLDYQRVLGNPEPNKGEATYYRYTRQVSFYLDQLYNDTAALKATGVIPDNHVTFSVSYIKQIFALVMQKLSYHPLTNKQTLQYITQGQADRAFDMAMQSLHLSLSQTLAVSDNSAAKNDRHILFSLIEQALTSVESEEGFKFSAVTEKGKPLPLLSSIPGIRMMKHTKQLT